MMLTPVSLFPLSSHDPARAAEAVSGDGVYLTIGDQFEQLLAGIETGRLDPSGKSSAPTLAVLAMVTLFQFAEDLPDRRAAEAIRMRPGWKYALHLARTHPEIDHTQLCEFRQPLLHDPAARHVLQQLIDRLAETDPLKGADRQQTAAAEILTAVCRLSRLEQLIEAMRMVLEALATFEPEWLRTITLPHWYERYSQMHAARVLPKSKEGQVRLAQAIGADVMYLLEAIAKAGDSLIALPETQALQQAWFLQFELAEHQFQWRLPVCAACCLL
jgi:hypothetical protein